MELYTETQESTELAQLRYQLALAVAEANAEIEAANAAAAAAGMKESLPVIQMNPYSVTTSLGQLATLIAQSRQNAADLMKKEAQQRTEEACEALGGVGILSALAGVAVRGVQEVLRHCGVCDGLEVGQDTYFTPKLAHGLAFAPALQGLGQQSPQLSY